MDLTEALTEERRRIAEILHDSVLQDLFATTLHLASTETVADPVVAARIAEAVEALDQTMHSIRQAVFGLRVGELAR